MCKAPTALILMAAAVCLSLTLSGQEVAISSVAVQGEHVIIAWRGPSGWNHVLQYTTLLPATQWTDVLTVPSAPAMNERTLLLPAGQGYGFYRVVCGASLDSPGPRLFFTDLESGPNRGGQDDLGCYVTLWGEGFGASRGESKVTMGGREVARYVEWGQDNAWARKLDMIVVQPGSNVVSGDIEVVVNGKRSNPLPFTVRPGRIYFVSPAGDDSKSGDFGSPFGTVTKAKDTLAPGDIAYLMDGLAQTTEETWSAALAINSGGTPGAPKALIAYPGALAMIGSTNLQYGVRGEDYLAPSSATALITGGNNLWFGNGLPPGFLSNNLNVDPRFRDRAAHDFTLLPDSPAIDAGSNDGPAFDYLGQARPHGTATDLGAFEFAP